MTAFRHLILLGTLVSTPLYAQSMSSDDPRIQQLVYAPNQVFNLRVATGFVATIVLSPDERIDNVAVGNSNAWQVTANKRGDHLFVKPLQDGVTTNLEIVTDARRYSLVLTPSYSGDMSATLELSFRYPATTPVAPDAPSEVTVAPKVHLYRLSGDRRLRPSEMSDDGERTRIRWPADLATPAIYMINAIGAETLVNPRVVDGSMIIDRVADRLVFRLGKDIAKARRIADKGDRR